VSLLDAHAHISCDVEAKIGFFSLAYNQYNPKWLCEASVPRVLIMQRPVGGDVTLVFFANEFTGTPSIIVPRCGIGIL
jgi:hypothetical protein